MKADIAWDESLTGLREKVNALLMKGWRVEGAPFADSSTRRWCWAVVLDGAEPVAPGGIKLREPVRAVKR